MPELAVAACPCGDPGSPYYAVSSRPYGPSLCRSCWEKAAFDLARLTDDYDCAAMGEGGGAAPESGTTELLDWGNNSRTKGGVGAPKPCVICARPSVVRGPNGNPCHKGCAETHPERYMEWLSPSTVVAHVRDSRKSTRRTDA